MTTHTGAVELLLNRRKKPTEEPFPVEFIHHSGATPINGWFAEWVLYHAANQHQIPLDIRRGFGIFPRSIRGMGITYPHGFDSFGCVCGNVVFHGFRSLSRPVSRGYHMEGRISISGTNRRAFTSSILVECPAGELINIGVLYAIGIKK